MISPRPSRQRVNSSLRSIGVGAVTLIGAKWLFACFPSLQLNLLAQGTARVTAVLVGSSVLRGEHGWRLPGAATPVEVTAACSAVDFACLVAGLIAWQLAKRWRRSIMAGPLGLGLALPVALTVNAVRVAALTQVHRWVIPHLPPSYAAFTHLFTGVAIFLPALIGLNLLLEHYGNRHASIRDHG